MKTAVPDGRTAQGLMAEQQQATPRLEATIFKGTTLPHISVRRRCVLQGNGGCCPGIRRASAAAAGLSRHSLQPWLLFPATCLAAAEFTTFQVDKGISTGKVWCLHRKCTLEPGSSSLIRAHERHLRKAGPLRALSAYARDKNVLKIVSSILTGCCLSARSRRSCFPPASYRLADVSSSGRCWPSAGCCAALQFCFRVEWPDKYAPSQGSTVELGFETLPEAQVGFAQAATTAASPWSCDGCTQLQQQPPPPPVHVRSTPGRASCSRSGSLRHC